MNRNTIKTLLRRILPGLVLIRKLSTACQRVMIYTKYCELLHSFAHCGADLEIDYPWDIRGAQWVEIGKDVYIGPHVLMIAESEARIHIGDNTMLGPQVKIIAFNHRFDDPQKPIKHSGYAYGEPQSVWIENDVWIGAGAFIMKGVRIGKGSIVAAGAVLTKSVGENEIWGGNPARKIKDRFAAADPPVRST